MFPVQTAKEHLGVKDVSRKSANLLRSSLIGSLMGVLKTNYNAGNKPCRMYEISDTFVPTSEKLPVERTKLALVCDSDIRQLRGVLSGLLKNIARGAELEIRSVELPWAEVGADIELNGRAIGCIGVVSEDVKDKFDLEDARICAAEIDFDMLIEMESDSVTFKSIPRYPAIDRDLSLLIDEPVTWKEITTAVESVSCDKLEDINYVGTYRGKGVDSGKKSLTLTLRYRDEDGTLTHEQVDEYDKAILASLESATGAVLRRV